MSIYGLDRPSIIEFPKLTGRKETPNSTTRRETAALNDQVYTYLCDAFSPIESFVFVFYIILIELSLVGRVFGSLSPL
jgi:hypothetical protein